MTDLQLVEYLASKGHTFTPSGARTRRAELVSMGLLVDTGKRVLNPQTGRNSTVWGVA
jgi:hypothetical protein